MTSSLRKCDTIISLHDRGYTEDFAMDGNRFFWVQRKIQIHRKYMAITEYYCFEDLSGYVSIVFGVAVSRYAIKGILISHHNKILREFFIINC